MTGGAPASPVRGDGGPVREQRDLRVPENLQLPALVAMVPGAVDEVRDEPVTFRQLQHDTADLRLARWGADLRVRLDGPDRGWRLALPADEGTGAADVVDRAVAADETGDDVPDELLDLVRPLVREAAVRPVTELRTTRTSLHLRDARGQELATVHDDLVEAVLPRGGVRRLRRLRIVGQGPPPDAGRAVTRLTDAITAAVEAGEGPPVGDATGATTAARRTAGDETGPGDLPRGLPRGAEPFGLPGAGPADVVVPRRPGRHGTAGDVLTYALAAHVRSFLLADVAVRRDRPDAVHRLRVAGRTLRSTLRTFTPLCDEGWAHDLRDRLGGAADALGAVRDTEVLYARLEADAERLSPADRVRVLPALDELLRPRLLDARASALRELRSDRYLQLLVDLVEATRHPRLSAKADAKAAAVLPALVADDWAGLVHAVRRLRSERLDPRDPAWHRARILAKRARYGAEATVPALGGRARRWAHELSEVTDLLGRLHDGVVAAGVLQDAAAGADGPSGFALGRLLALQDAAVEAAADDFLERWPRVRRRLERRGLG